MRKNMKWAPAAIVVSGGMTTVALGYTHWHVGRLPVGYDSARAHDQWEG
jgi:hypothetical protein